MSGQPKTTAEFLRNPPRSRADELESILNDELRPKRDAVEAANDAHEAHDATTLGTLVETLAEAVGDTELVVALRDAEVETSYRLDQYPAEAFGTFIEAFDTAYDAFETFVDLRDSESYPGIGEERRDAWEEVVAATVLLADALEALELEE